MDRLTALFASCLLLACDIAGHEPDAPDREAPAAAGIERPTELGASDLDACYLQCDSEALGCYDDVIAEGGALACDPFGEIGDCRWVRADCRSTCETGLPG